MSQAPSPAPDSVEEFTWNDDYLLGYDPMDDTHREFVEVVHALDTASDADMATALARFVAHAEAHFAQEYAWMSLPGFPARDCHAEEHDKVLASAYQVQGLVAEGHYDVGRSFAVALKEWFPGHADYLDSALAKWMVKQNTGGSPVVLRRTGKAAQASAGKDTK
jgi:hemerythrin